MDVFDPTPRHIAEYERQTDAELEQSERQAELLRERFDRFRWDAWRCEPCECGVGQCEKCAA